MVDRELPDIINLDLSLTTFFVNSRLLLYNYNIMDMLHPPIFWHPAGHPSGLSCAHSILSFSHQILVGVHPVHLLVVENILNEIFQLSLS